MIFSLLLLATPLDATTFDGGISDSALCENCFVVMPNYDAWTTTHDAASDAGRRQRRRSDGGSVAPPPEGGCSCGTTNIGELTFLAFLMFMMSASYEFRNILTSRRRK
jgi:hypothetical protein